MCRFKNPYDYTFEDYKGFVNTVSPDLVDSSGFLNLKDQISIILSQSEINNEFRRGLIDRFNEDKVKLIEDLSDFEENEYVNDQLYKARSGDLIDKETLLNNAYRAGYTSGFYPQNRDSDLGDTPTFGADADKNDTNNTETTD